MAKELPRFEVRDCRSGYIEGVCGNIERATAYARGYRAEGYGPCFIVDVCLPLPDDGDRIVWRDDEPTDRAIAWLRAHQTKDVHHLEQ